MGDRYFTIQNASCSITDNIGHYVFNISFVDGDPAEVQGEPMGELAFYFEEV